MDKEEHGFKRLAFLAIAVVVAVVLAKIFESGEGNSFIYLAGAFVGGAAVLGFFRPDLVDFDGN